MMRGVGQSVMDIMVRGEAAMAVTRINSTLVRMAYRWGNSPPDQHGGGQ